MESRRHAIALLWQTKVRYDRQAPQQREIKYELR